MELLQPSELADAADGVYIHGGTEVVPLLRDGILDAARLIDIRAVVPRGVHDNVIGAGTTLSELGVDPKIPDALREACRLAASPQLRNMGSIGGNLLQATRCWYWRLAYPCRLHGGDTCFARDGEHREHAIFANDFCASAHPSDVAAVLLALDARLTTTERRLPLADLYRVPSAAARDAVRLQPGELILELTLPPVERSVYLKAMDRRRWSFPQVGVAAAHVDGATRIALAGVAPIPWLLDSPEALETATPLPRTEWKVQVAKALVQRAQSQLASGAPR